MTLKMLAAPRSCQGRWKQSGFDAIGQSMQQTITVTDMLAAFTEKLMKPEHPCASACHSAIHNINRHLSKT